jgi:hypothetical protein
MHLKFSIAKVEADTEIGLYKCSLIGIYFYSTKLSMKPRYLFMIKRFHMFGQKERPASYDLNLLFIHLSHH